VRLIRVRLVLVNLNPINDTYNTRAHRTFPKTVFWFHFVSKCMMGGLQSACANATQPPPACSLCQKNISKAQAFPRKQNQKVEVEPDKSKELTRAELSLLGLPHTQPTRLQIRGDYADLKTGTAQEIIPEHSIAGDSPLQSFAERGNFKSSSSRTEGRARCAYV